MVFIIFLNLDLISIYLAQKALIIFQFTKEVIALIKYLDFIKNILKNINYRAI